MLFTLINYSTNNFNLFLELNYLFNIKKKFLKNLKIKIVKLNILLNIKQVIFLMIINKIWRKIKFKNLLIIITLFNYDIKNQLDGLMKLNLISRGIIDKTKVNLKLIFEKLKNIIWTSIGYFEVKDFYFFLTKHNLNKKLIIIESIDKIPFLTKHYIPKNIRISNTNRVRLGSYISKNVTIMSEGYVNFNTYIGENCMIEGRVSAGVYVSDYCDIGGSASIMGTLSGGGGQIISIGKECLLGANSGLGICLGNNCIIESGLYITYNSKITIFFKNKLIIIKAKYLSYINNLIFYRNSISGKINCCKNKVKMKFINNTLHNNK